MTNLDSILKSRDITLPTKVHLVKSYGFSSSHVWMWELDYKESWAPKNWCFWTVVWEKTLESLLDCKEIKPVNPKGNQSWILIGRTDAFALWCWRRHHWVSWTARRSNQSIPKGINPEYLLEALMLKLKLRHLRRLMQRGDIGKDPDAGKDWRQEGVTENELVR